MTITLRGMRFEAFVRGLDGRVRARRAALIAVLLASCGGSGSPPPPPARVAPFVVFDWRVDSEADPPGGSTASWDIWKDDGSGSLFQLTTAESSHVWSFSPTISPDGTRIAFVGIEEGTGDAHIFTMTNTGFSLKQITFGHVHDLDPTWSPNGQRLAISSDRDGVRSIWTIRADGTGAWHVSFPSSGDPASGDVRPSYSPDSLRIAFQRWMGGDDHDIWVQNAWVGSAERLTTSPATDIDPVWKPDGTRIAFASNRFGGGFRIFQMNVDGTGQVKTDPYGGPGTDIQNFRPTWTADGSRIWYVSRFEPGDLQGDQSIHSMKPDAGGDAFEEEMILPSEFDHPDVHP